MDSDILVYSIVDHGNFIYYNFTAKLSKMKNSHSRKQLEQHTDGQISSFIYIDYAFLMLLELMYYPRRNQSTPLHGVNQEDHLSPDLKSNFGK